MKTNNINTKRNKLKERNKNVKLCKESVNFFLTHGFIDELSTDEKYYTHTLINYFLSRIDKTRKRTEELEDAIDYISWKQEEQTSDKQFYMIALLEYCINN
jgi:hypothetical protein|tara:strand:- start:494 stop:796 length:303 start_codon:yes stop_codon:yes gene_type:complete